MDDIYSAQNTIYPKKFVVCKFHEFHGYYSYSENFSLDII